MSTPPASPKRTKADTPARDGGTLKRQNTTAGVGWVWDEEWRSLKVAGDAVVKMIVDAPEGDDQMAVKGATRMQEGYKEMGEVVPGLEILYGFNDEMIDEAAQKAELVKTLSDVKFPVKMIGASELMETEETPTKASYMVICSPLGGQKEGTLTHLSDMSAVMAKAGVDDDTIVIFTSCDKYNYKCSSPEGMEWLDARERDFPDTTVYMSSAECMLRPSAECIRRSGMAGSHGMKAWMEFTLRAALCPVDSKTKSFWINLIFNGKTAGSNAKGVSEMASVLEVDFAPYSTAREVALRYMARDWRVGMSLMQRMEDAESEIAYIEGLEVGTEELEGDANWAETRGLCDYFMPWMKDGAEPDEEMLEAARKLKDRLQVVMAQLELEWDKGSASKHMLCSEAMRLSYVLYSLRVVATLENGTEIEKDFWEMTDAEHGDTTDYTFITKSTTINVAMLVAAFYGLWDKVTQWVAERAAILVMGTERETGEWIAKWKEDMDTYPQDKDDITDEEVENCPSHIAVSIEESFVSGRFQGMTPVYDMAALIPLFAMMTGKMSPTDAQEAAKDGHYAGEKGKRMLEEMMLSVLVSGER